MFIVEMSSLWERLFIMALKRKTLVVECSSFTGFFFHILDILFLRDIYN